MTPKEKKTPKGDYAVGYAKTPVHTRFQKGNPGNRKGRAKGRPSFDEIVREERARILKLPSGDKAGPTDRMLVRKTNVMALKGNMAAMRIALALVAKTLGDSSEAQAPVEEPLTKDELEVLKMLGKFKGSV